MDGIKLLAETAILEMMVQEIERSSMPQVKNKEIPEVLEIFDKYGISYKKGLVECGKLRPTQEDYKPEKVEDMVEKIKSGDWKDSPIFISKDGFILDGHHRWLAYKQAYGDDHKIPVIRIDLLKDDALRIFAAGADKVSEDIINESPDIYIDPKSGKKVIYHEGGRPFGYYKNIMYVYPDEGDHTHYDIGKFFELGVNPARERFVYPGRIWVKNKIISFWKYPPKSKFKKIITDLEKSFSRVGKSIKIWGDPKYRVEVIMKGEKISPGGIQWYSDEYEQYDDKTKDLAGDKEHIEFIPLKDYGGSKKRKKKELGQQHVVSPKLKSKKEVPVGVGSKKKIKGAIPNELPVTTKFRQRKGLGDGVLPSDIIDEEIDPGIQKLATSLGVEINDDMSVRLKDITEIRGNKMIVCLPGRFQPFHQNHFEAYQHLVKKFGKDNVYVATSNKVEPDKSPFNFVEKKQIMTKMFGIPANKIIQVSNPYNNMSYKSIGNMDTDVLVVGLGEKDAGRLASGGKFYEKYKEGNKQPFKEKGYVYTVPLKTIKIGGKMIGGTVVRNIFKQGSDKAKQQLFKKLFGKFDNKIYKLIVGKLNESIILSSEVIEEFLLYNYTKKIIYETTKAADGTVDDGPATFYKHPRNYQKNVKDIIGKLGWQIIDYLAGDKEEYADQTYKYDHVSDVSFGDVGVRDTDYPDPIAKYKRHMNQIASSLGYSVIDWLMSDDKKKNIIDDPEKEMATHEPLRQDTSDASEPIKEGICYE